MEGDNFFGGGGKIFLEERLREYKASWKRRTGVKLFWWKFNFFGGAKSFLDVDTEAASSIFQKLEQQSSA